ncbi:MAG: hypothetical protein GY756_17960 [bacterium]|nr:hypothetical protein [bacterium]
MEKTSYGLNGFNRPAISFSHINLSPEQKKELKKVVKNQLDIIFKQTDIRNIRYIDNLEIGSLSIVSKYLLNRGAVPSSCFSQIIDLSLHEKLLKIEIRKSFKSLINWGNNNLRITIINSQNVTRNIMEQFKQLHIFVAKRETRNQKTWKIQFEQIKNQEAFLIIGVLKNKLITGAFFIYNKRTCHYGVSVSRRDMFDKPLSHSILWHAILYAKKLGCRFFELGDQFFKNNFDKDNISNKELNICNFKRGFGGNTKVKLLVEVKDKIINLLKK